MHARGVLQQFVDPVFLERRREEMFASFWREVTVHLFEGGKLNQSRRFSLRALYFYYVFEKVIKSLPAYEKQESDEYEAGGCADDTSQHASVVLQRVGNLGEGLKL